MLNNNSLSLTLGMCEEELLQRKNIIFLREHQNREVEIDTNVPLVS